MASNAHTPVHTAEIWRKRFFIPWKHFYYSTRIIDKSFTCLKGRHLALCLYLPSWWCHFFFRYHCLKTTNYCIFLHIYLLKKACGKWRTWHFWAPKCEKFSGEACPHTPLVCSMLGGLTFLSMCTPLKPYATPLHAFCNFSLSRIKEFSANYEVKTRCKNVVSWELSMY